MPPPVQGKSRPATERREIMATLRQVLDYLWPAVDTQR
jgi:hypothetical protein